MSNAAKNFVKYLF